MKILGIDPGPQESGFVVYDPVNHSEPLSDKGIIDNDVLLWRINNLDFAEVDMCAIEAITSSNGQPVADETFRTVLWTGRIVQAWVATDKPMPLALWRATIGGALCHGIKKNDSLIGAALRTRFNEPLSPKHPKGPLRDFKDHMWAALAVAVCAGDGIKSSFKDGTVVTFGSVER